MANVAVEKNVALPWRDRLSSLGFALPALFIFATFYIYPFLMTFGLALREWNGISPYSTFVGLENFFALLRDKVWWGAVGNAFSITLIALTFQNALAFALALACDREIRMKNFYRMVFFIPPILSEVVVGLIWRLLLEFNAQGQQYPGTLNYFLDMAGLHHLVNNWLSNPRTALACVAVVHSWKGFGWGFVMFLAGLQVIDRQLYEAAKVDGAGPLATLRYVTIPMMVPVMLVVMILTILGSMQAFVLILSMMGQGLGYHVEVPVTRILTAMTWTQEYGYACSMGVTFGMILVAFSFVFKKVFDRMKQE